VVKEKDEKTKIWRLDGTTNETQENEDFGDTTTVEVDRDRLPGEMPVALRARFEILTSDGRNEVIDLGDREILIGRSPSCDISLSSESVSRRHARLTFRNEEYFIEDLNSTNGLYVNAIKVEKCVLRNNDQIEIGGIRMLFHEEKTLQDTQ
jgi:pSer/pThr/pTyr-binding forkhead associated (FHA) protein